MEQMSEIVADADYHQIQHFISESPWDARVVMDEVASATYLHFADCEEVYLIVDESGHTKNGNKSVGVARQYSGQLGKVDNCQVAVYAALSAGHHYSLIDARLYLPEEWTSDKQRCKSAHIPKESIKFKTKQLLIAIGIAFEMVVYHKKKDTRFHWVGGDGFYGHDNQFRSRIAALNLFYMLDIHSTDVFFMEKPIIGVPEKKAGKGRPPSLLKTDGVTAKVCDIVKNLRTEDWKTYTIRNTAKGPLVLDVWVQEVYTWDGSAANCRKELLVVHRNRKEAGTLTKTSRY